MATHARLKKRAELKAGKLTRKTFRSLCICTAVFLSATIGIAIVMSRNDASSSGKLPTGFLMFLGQGQILMPIRPVSTAPKQ